MTKTFCPHCGTPNFYIAAYCTRCQRPLPAKTAKHYPVALPPPPAPPPPAVAPPPTPRLELRDLTPSEALGRGPLSSHESSNNHRQEVLLQPLSAPTELVANGAAAAANLSLAASPSVITLRIAPRWRRAIGLCIDAVPYAVVVVLTLLGGALLQSEAWPPIDFQQAPLDLLAAWLNRFPHAGWHAGIVAACLAFVYNMLLGRHHSRSLGQRLTGTYIVDRGGHPLGATARLWRTLVALASGLLLGAGFFWIIVDSQSRTWHDLICGTLCVLEPRAKPRARQP